MTWTDERPLLQNCHLRLYHCCCFRRMQQRARWLGGICGLVNETVAVSKDRGVMDAGISRKNLQPEIVSVNLQIRRVTPFWQGVTIRQSL